MFMAIVAMLVLPDFPHNSRHFSKTELELAQLRMTEDAGTADETTVSSWTAFKLAMCDIKLWTMSLLLLIMVIGLSCKSFFSLRLMSTRALLTPPFLPLSRASSAILTQNSISAHTNASTFVLLRARRTSSCASDSSFRVVRSKG